MTGRFGIDSGSALHRYAFIGELSVTPKYVAPSERGAGFAEIARAILEARA